MSSRTELDGVDGLEVIAQPLVQLGKRCLRLGWQTLPAQQEVIQRFLHHKLHRLPRKNANRKGIRFAALRHLAEEVLDVVEFQFEAKNSQRSQELNYFVILFLHTLTCDRRLSKSVVCDV